MHFRRALLGLGAAALAFGIVLPASATQGHQSGSTSSKACNDGTASVSPAILWPPNHKLNTVTISYAENENNGSGDGDQIAITSISESMVDGSGAADVEGHGAGQPAAQQGPDYVAPASMPPANPDTATWSTTAQIRSERAGTVGNGSGRVYTLTVTCKDSGGTDANDPAEANPAGQTQMVMLHVCVPHDMSDKSLAFCQGQL